MRTFMKIAAMGVVIAGGSLLTLWQAIGGHLLLSWLSLLTMAALTFALIKFIAGDAKNAPIHDGSSLIGAALGGLMHLILSLLRSSVAAARKGLLAAFRAAKNAAKRDASGPADGTVPNRETAASDA